MNHANLKRFLLPEHQPRLAATAWAAPGSVLVGAVTLAEEASVWYTAVLRGDINHVIVGERSNIQDGAVLHVSDDFACEVGALVTVGHRAIVHACKVGDETLVGMGAIILDGAEIGPRCMIGAGALVTKGARIPEGSLVVGSPARVVRSLTAEERAANARLALKYVEIAKRYRALEA